MIGDWRASCTPTDDGHLLWTGHRNHGTPSLIIGRRKYSVPAHVYAQIHHRKPTGHVTTTCRIPDCVLPEHLVDADDRQIIHQAAAAAMGRPTTEGHCAKGHAWVEWAYFGSDGRRSCWACRTGQPEVVNDLAIEFALAGCPEDLARPDALETVRRAICVRGLTHVQAAALVERSPRTIARWARAYGWRKKAAG
jgi:hypothetical protein